MNSLLIVGTMAFDEVETPQGNSGKIIGGAGTYIGVSASHFGVKSALVSIVGDDFPSEYLSDLKNKNIDISGIQIVTGKKSFYWKGKYHTDMNSRTTITTDLNVLSDFKPIIPAEFKKPKVLMLGNLHPQIQLDVLSQLTEKPKLIVLDTMNYWMNHTWDLLMQVIENVDVITINDEEARQLTGEFSVVKAAKKIMKMGVKFVVIKKGEHGALLFHKDDVFFAPALPLEEVFDPTGAGDTFAGGMVGYISKSDDYTFETIKKSMIHGANMASFCVEKFGLERIENLTQNEISERLEKFRKLTQF